MRNGLGQKVLRAAVARFRAARVALAHHRLHSALAKLGPVTTATSGPAILIDGLWDNPNHFLRLRIFLEGVPNIEGHQLIGVLRTRQDRTKRMLETYGCRTFVFLDETAPAAFTADAKAVLSSVASHRELLDIRLPNDLPAYVLYDTALKNARHPQPKLEHRAWLDAVATQFRDVAVASRIFAGQPIVMVALSHPWKSEYGALVWEALTRGIPTIHLTAFCEAIRMRRMRNVTDYRVPVEHLPHAIFSALPEAVRDSLSQIGHRYLSTRAKGIGSDINSRSAYLAHSRIDDRGEARKVLAGVEDDRPVVLVSSHVWFDFPHTFAMRNFTDFKDWIEVTISAIRQNRDAVWLLKPHPTEDWYGGFRLTDIAGELASNVRLLPVKSDVMTALTAADAVVTVHGTIAFEAAARGRHVLAADRSHFSDWPFAQTAISRDDYVARLRALPDLVRAGRPLSADSAAAAIALSFAEPPTDVGALVVKCDSRGVEAYNDALSILSGPASSRLWESMRVRKFLEQDAIDSFATFHLLDTLGVASPTRQHAVGRAAPSGTGQR